MAIFSTEGFPLKIVLRLADKTGIGIILTEVV